ncbi:MAG: zinc ribbon domain-containing protein [Proteobacteria bacterium]|nr:zinc ribbon domain-containing protein [Pseudomonadota bacterium]MBU1419963.1 zinc ribbon domain-containing protein [Pseudomonadota bacterium]MBU1454479.1 zinc ribbon domain-containing protein [Pseudomonadota bacterium]
MPIYEFYCDHCNVIFNFFSSRTNTTTQPDCPRCGKKEISRQMSTFATLSKAREDGDDGSAGLDETRMEEAFVSLMKESEGMNEDDPRQMATLMRKFTEKTGMHLGDTMEEAVSRMEKGEDPDAIEQEMGDRLEGDDLFSFAGMKKKVLSTEKQPPSHDEKLYELKAEG